MGKETAENQKQTPPEEKDKNDISSTPPLSPPKSKVNLFLFFILTVLCSFLVYLVVSIYFPAVLQHESPQILRTDERGHHLFTSEELEKYSGEHGGKDGKIYLAIMGRVYDVSSGDKHYGPGGGYTFFTGKDGTRAFVTGDFTPKGLIPNVTGLSGTQMLEIQSWVEKYEKDYIYVGKLIGHYYDESGRPTKNHKYAEALLRTGRKDTKLLEENRKKYPGCNSKWEQGKGGEIWCTEKSGGIDRHWVGVPRMYKRPNTKDMECVCVPENEADRPEFKPYDNCNPKSASCKRS